MRIGVPGDAPTGAEVEVPVLQPERADGDVELADPGVGVDPADRPAVDTPGGRLQPAQVLDGGQLGSAGHRAGRKGGVEELGPAEPGAQVPLDGADQVDEAGVGLDPAQ